MTDRGAIKYHVTFLKFTRALDISKIPHTVVMNTKKLYGVAWMHYLWTRIGYL